MFESVEVRLGSNSEVESRSRRVRFTPMAGHRQTGPTGPFRAITGSEGDSIT